MQGHDGANYKKPIRLIKSVKLDQRCCNQLKGRIEERSEKRIDDSRRKKRRIDFHDRDACVDKKEPTLKKNAQMERC